MEVTILLAKVFGVYMIVGGLALWMRQKYFMSVVHNFVEEPMMRLIVALAEFVGGLFLIMTHNVWGSFTESVISAIGWILALEGVFYLLAPDAVVKSLIKTFNARWWYTLGGLVSIVLGLYLVNFGFGLF